jgi:hypothetical protein
MLLKRLLAGSILLPLFASTTWGVGCDLRCSLGQVPSSEQESAAGSAVPSAGSNRVEMADAKMPPEHCHHMAEMEESSPAVPLNCAHATDALCSHQSCEYASALVSQLRNIHSQGISLRIVSSLSPLNSGYGVQAAMERVETRGSSPPLLSLRI